MNAEPVRRFMYRPQLRGSRRWSPTPPVGWRPWSPTVGEEPYRAGRKPRKRSNPTHVLCCAGPLHESRLRRTTKGKAVSADLPADITVKPWQGTYRYVEHLDVYVWVDRTLSLKDHDRIWGVGDATGG